ncbi:MAG: class I SAM-dependent methyltransferase [Gammaproteobacteria bacterium]|nr:class I SAM-dependent methyltransferase [Gammaproteobacteria bacterium]
MANGVDIANYTEREINREDQFKKIWSDELNDVFADVAKYYDRANWVASFGLWGWLHRSFISLINLSPGMQALDVCAGTNAIGICMLTKEPGIKVQAIDRSQAMQEVGRQRAEVRGFHIDSAIGDVHHLPFPDNHFDVVTLQYASRHLRVVEVFKEIHRVLKPGGCFYHSDMLRPENKVVEFLYYSYLRMCLGITGWLFRSSPSALACKRYFISALSMFYSSSELSDLLTKLGFKDVLAKNVLLGMVGFHRAVKPDS